MSRSKKDVAEATPSGPVRLAYVGNGRRFVIGVPATDIEIEDPEEAARLIETGLYVVAEGSPAGETSTKPDDAADKAGESTGE